MLVLHAASAEDELLFWAETSIESDVHSDVHLPQPAHPFAAGAAELGLILRDLQLCPAEGDRQLSFRLPTRKGQPLASSPLVDNALDPITSGKPALWNVCGLAMPPLPALAALTRAAAGQLLMPGVVAGDDLRFWAAVSALAVGLVARQRFLPGLRQRSAQWYARWEPVISGDDLERLADIVAAAPDICRATVSDGHRQESALQATYRFLCLYVDQLVRAGGGGTKSGGSQAAIHDRWLDALRSADGRLQASQEEIARLQTDLARWKSTLNKNINAGFRLCFRLQEPAGDEADDAAAAGSGDPWKLSYFLQATNDPSLLIPADAVWSGRNLPNALKSTRSAAREYLLAALGTASAIYPPLERSLLSASPQDAMLSVFEAHEFLNQHSLLLQQAGFKVMLPSWWRRRKIRARAAVGAQSSLKSKGKLSLDQVIDFRWQLAIGDQQISVQELEALARLKVPLVRMRGQWIELDPEQIQQALAFLKEHGRTMTLRQLLMLTVGAEAPAAGTLLFDGVTGGGWIDDLMENFQGQKTFAEIDVPRQFNGVLRPYQQRGYSWLDYLSSLGLGSCLADDMGLGKTVQALALIEKNWHAGAPGERRPVLLICPMSVVGNWQKEAARFAPDLPVHVHHGGSRRKGEQFAETAAGQAIVISSYGLLFRDRDAFFNTAWSGIIIDEAQNIKNPETKQAKVARLLQGDYKIALTGTPVENNVGDLWSIMEFLNPGLLGNQAQFKRNFLLPIQTERDPVAIERLHRLTGPFILRRLKSDKSIIKDLPEKLEMKDYCNLTREQATLYQAVVRDVEQRLAQDIEPIERKGLVLATLVKLKQVCNHPALFLHDDSPLAERSGKLSRLTSMIEEALQIGDRLLVFSQFAEMGALLQRHIQETFGREVLFLHGGVVKAQRDRLVERFQDKDGPPVFVLSLKAGGVGLNLTAANQVVHFDRWWNPAVENQATDRAYRIGQQRSVQVHKYICAGTLEEKIDQIIEGKLEVAQSIVGSGEGWLTKLDNRQLKELLHLSKEAVAQ